MASKSSKPKPFTYTFILLLIILLFFIIHTLRQLHNELQRGAITDHPKHVKNPKWFEVIAREMRDEIINVGLVNIDGTTIMKELHTKGRVVKVDFDPVDEAAVQWSDLFPEWINENSPSNCPKIPMPKFENYHDLDVVVARVPCDKDDGLRNSYSLQVNLVVANLLVRSGRKDRGVDRPVFAVFIGSCGPMWEIFRCDDLLWHGENENSWVYKPEMRRIRHKVLMPVGSCQLAPWFEAMDVLQGL